MQIAIMQPTYLPWLGYFDLMAHVDAFVFLDDVQFSKQSWQQRNRIKTPKGLEWITVPVLIKGRFGQTIAEVELRDAQFWLEHFRTLEVAYSRAPFWKMYRQELNEVYQSFAGCRRLIDVNLALLEWLKTKLEIATPTVLASDLQVEGKRSERLVSLCRALGADHYLSPLGSAEYLDLERELFQEAGIGVTLQNYLHPTYPQLFPPFIAYASVIDLVLNAGPNAREILMSGHSTALTLSDVRERDATHVVLPIPAQAPDEPPLANDMRNRLRDVTWQDKEMILEWRNLPEVAKYMYTDHVILQDEHTEWFDRIMQDPSRRYWIIVSGGQDVGLANIYSIDRQNRRCYWAFYVANTSVRGRGVGSFVEYSILHYVFDVLHLNKLCCEVLAFNEAVLAMHKRYGFREEGLEREHIFKQGEPLDVLCLAMLRAEWDLRKDELKNNLQQKGIL